MSEDKHMSVNILDKEYQVACNPDERHQLIQAANELDRRMRAVRQSGSIVGLERIAIMVALNLCHELHQGANNKSAPEINASLERISSKLDSALR